MSHSSKTHTVHSLDEVPLSALEQGSARLQIDEAVAVGIARLAESEERRWDPEEEREARDHILPVLLQEFLKKMRLQQNDLLLPINDPSVREALEKRVDTLLRARLLGKGGLFLQNISFSFRPLRYCLSMLPRLLGRRE